MNDLKYMINRYWGNKNACAISSLDLKTLNGGGKETVAVIVHEISINYDNVISLRETGV